MKRILFLIILIQSINIFFGCKKPAKIPRPNIILILTPFFFSIYSIYLNLKYGGTLGKLAIGIRVTKPDGKPIGLREALLRSSVDIVFGGFFAIFQVYAISQVDPGLYLSAGYAERAKILVPLYPEYKTLTDILMQLWFWSEMVVLLFNKRNRALHDYIARTVVIHKGFA